MSPTAIVTGASKGIGAAIAVQLAKDGYNVVVNYNGNHQKAEEVKALCDQHTAAIVVQGDVSKADDCARIAAAAIETFGSVDVLVNNAGITKDNLLLRMSEADFDAVVDTNLKGTWLMSKTCVRHLMKNAGAIVNISSIVGRTGNAGQTNYAASKAGVIGFTMSLAKELASRNVRVNAVAPGFIKSDMTDKLNEDQSKQMFDRIPLGRFGTPQEVADLVSFLVSEKSRYITGQTIGVDGGMAM
jgi:3-oxoacyl-[acyl-carrier protein] reductase